MSEVGPEEKVIPILRVRDADVAVAWYKRLGFQQTSVHRFEPGFPAFVTIERGPMKLFLSEHKGDARPDTLIPCSCRRSSVRKGIWRESRRSAVGIRNRNPRSRCKPSANRDA